MDISKVARILDVRGAYNLADKLDKMAQQYSKGQIPKGYGGAVYTGAQYFDNPTTPKEILNIRNQLIPKDFRAEIAKVENKKFINPSLLDSNDAQSFVNALFQFGKSNGLTNLTQTFDAYADAGASYNGESIKNNEALKSLYMMIRQTPKMFTPKEIVDNLKSFLSQ